jgi:hypothetical protein
MHPLMSAAVLSRESTDAVLDREARVHARRWGLLADDGTTRCLKCGKWADARMLHCGSCLVVRYGHNHPGSEWQLWPALERILRNAPLTESSAWSLISAIRAIPHARPDWLTLLENVVRARFAPNPDDDWRTR